MSDLTQLKKTTSEKLIDMVAARIKQDYKNLSAMMSWLRAHKVATTLAGLFNPNIK